jgi:DNA-binding MarR family transcriptional regulator
LASYDATVSDVRQPEPARPRRTPSRNRPAAPAAVSENRGLGPASEQRGPGPAQAHPLSWALRDLMRAGDEVDHSLAKRLELNPTDYAAMNHLMSGARQLGPVELGALLGMTSGSATGLVDRLETAGHVRRQPHPSDRRRLVVAPTESATRTVLDVLRPMLDALDALGDEFSEPEQRAIQRYLQQAAARLRAYAADLDHRG